MCFVRELAKSETVVSLFCIWSLLVLMRNSLRNTNVMGKIGLGREKPNMVYFCRHAAHQAQAWRHEKRYLRRRRGLSIVSYLDKVCP
jgi:hypothetical protein